jgi:hypothetical protein
LSADDDERSLTTSQRRSARRNEFIIEKYKAAHPDQDGAAIEPHLIAPWAISRGLIKVAPLTAEEILRRQLSQHLKTRYTTDPQNRRVRKHHAVMRTVDTADGPKRFSSWHTIFEAPREHMKVALQARRNGALADVKQMVIDLESWNDNNIYGQSLPAMDVNFTPDVEESKMPTSYPSKPPEPPDDKDSE